MNTNDDTIDLSYRCTNLDFGIEIISLEDSPILLFEENCDPFILKLIAKYMFQRVLFSQPNHIVGNFEFLKKAFRFRETGFC